MSLNTINIYYLLNIYKVKLFISNITVDICCWLSIMAELVDNIFYTCITAGSETEYSYQEDEHILGE